MSKRVDAALSQPAVEGVAQVEAPGEHSGVRREREGGVALAFSAPRPSWFCPNGKPNEGEYSHAENDNHNRSHVDG